MDLGREQKVNVGGKVWTLGRLTVEAILNFRDWIEAQVGDPFADLAIWADRLPPDLWKEEYARCRLVRDQLRQFSLASDLAKKYLATEVGLAVLFCELLKPYHPEATPTDGLAMVMALGGRAGETLARAMGQMGNVGAPDEP